MEKNAKSTHIANHGYIAGLRDGGLDETGTFWTKKSGHSVADHVDHRLSCLDSLSSRVAPSHHQSHIWQDVRVVIDLKILFFPSKKKKKCYSHP